MICIPFCQNCGSNVDAGKKFCENCGAAVGPAPAPSAVPAGAPYIPPVSAGQPRAPGYGMPPSEQKSPGLAAIGSFFFSGLGQVYNGSFVKGLLMLIGVLIGYLIFFIPGLIVWVYGIYDAYTTAKKMNEGTIPFVAHKTSHILAFIVIGIVIAVIYFIVVYVIMAAAIIGLEEFSPY